MPAVVIHRCMFSNSSEFIYRTSLLGVTISTRLQQTYYQQQQHMSHFLTNHFTNQHHHHPLLTMLTCIVKRLRARFSCLAKTKLDIYTFGIFHIWLSDNDSNFVFFPAQPSLKRWNRLLLWAEFQFEFWLEFLKNIIESQSTLMTKFRMEIWKILKIKCIGTSTSFSWWILLEEQMTLELLKKFWRNPLEFW